MNFVIVQILSAAITGQFLNVSAESTGQISVPLQLILDAGHGGEDGGAVSCTGVPESQINLAIVQKLDQLFGFYGEAPILLRNEDISLHNTDAKTLRQKKISDLHNRVAVIETTENAAVISIHQNTFPKSGYHGTQVFFRSGDEESEALASVLQEALRHAAPDNERVPAKIPDTVYLMKHISCPAVLIECGFLSNPTEEALLRSPVYQSCLSGCILSGWLKYTQNQGGEHAYHVI